MKLNRNNINFIVQASSRSWSGGQDRSIKLVGGQPVVYLTLKKILKNFPKATVVVATPGFDKAGKLAEIVKKFNGRINLFCGFNHDPLSRIISAHKQFLSAEEKLFIRLDGLNLFFLPQEIRRLYRLADSHCLDCAKFPDDYPAQLTADVYNISALKQMKRLVSPFSPYSIHPKHYLFSNRAFKTEYFNPVKPKDSYLRKARALSKEIYSESRDSVTDSKMNSGDLLSFHYKLAAKHLRKNDVVLDVACGEGFGLPILSSRAKEVYGADISVEAINKAHTNLRLINKIKVLATDVADLPFCDDFFDTVTSFETIEHVNPKSYLREIRRVLKPGGRFIISTPQNRFGNIPINFQHNHEYSLEEFRRLISQYFQIEEIVGIKQGCIIRKNDLFGANTFAVLRNFNKLIR